MKVLLVAGPPASGKTSVLCRALPRVPIERDDVRLLKLDCLDAGDARPYQRAGYRARVELSGAICPDHHFVAVVGESYLAARAEGAGWLVVESAGLCDRCSPFLERVPAVCVLGLTANLHAPSRLRALVQTADAVVLTKADLVSQVEREVFLRAVREVNPDGALFVVNGLTGEGLAPLCRWIAARPDRDLLPLERLRTSLPRGSCQLCAGGLP